MGTAVVWYFVHRRAFGSGFRFAELFYGSAASLTNVASLARGPIYCLTQKRQGFG